MYHLVDSLNSLGFDAFAYHETPNFRLAWFENSTPVISPPEFTKCFDEEKDIFVVPEDLGIGILEIPGKKIVFDQNFFYGLASLGETVPGVYPYLDENILGIITLSAHNAKHLRFSFPKLPVSILVPHVDPHMFSFRRITGKRKKILCVAKVETHTRALRHMLYARAAQRLNNLDEFEWVPLRNLSEVEVAHHLQEALVLVF